MLEYILQSCNIDSTCCLEQPHNGCEDRYRFLRNHSCADICPQEPSTDRYSICSSLDYFRPHLSSEAGSCGARTPANYCHLYRPMQSVRSLVALSHRATYYHTLLNYWTLSLLSSPISSQWFRASRLRNSELGWVSSESHVRFRDIVAYFLLC